jgi:UPF0755 protein
MPSGRRTRRNQSWARAAALVPVAGVLAVCYLAMVDTSSPTTPPVRVVVPAGATFRVAAESLGAVGAVRFPRAFALYARLQGRDRTIRAGTYEVQAGHSWNFIIDVLHTGRGLVEGVTVPEGWRLRQIVPAVAAALGLPAESLEVAVRDSALRARVGTRVETLEGYLFPDTYRFLAGTPARAVVAAMVAQFEARWDPAWDRRLDTLKVSRHDVVTLASIVEKEAVRDEERPIIAAVYWNRLRTRMPLQADPTVQYARDTHASRVLYSHLRVDSPYNTYRNAGLPPGPIASPGTASLRATLYPAQVPFRFFVARPDGRHEFRRTYQEHLEAIRLVRELARADSVARAARADSVARDSAAARDSTP